jgi:hypothetical protein
MNSYIPFSMYHIFWVWQSKLFCFCIFYLFSLRNEHTNRIPIYVIVPSYPNRITLILLFSSIFYLSPYSLSILLISFVFLLLHYTYFKMPISQNDRWDESSPLVVVWSKMLSSLSSLWLESRFDIFPSKTKLFPA